MAEPYTLAASAVELAAFFGFAVVTITLAD